MSYLTLTKQYVLSLTFLVLTLLLLPKHAITQNTHNDKDFLFAIHNQCKWGFMDTLGMVVITPKYEETQDFSEGLGVFRENGLYGYLDKSGNIIISPQFYYAYAFSCGLALVYSKYGKPDYIDNKGKVAFKSNYKEAMSFVNGLAVVKTFSDKYGMINAEGKLYLDTLYAEIRYSYDYKFFTTIGFSKNLTKDNLVFENEIALYNSYGKLIVPSFKYSNIENNVRSFDFFSVTYPKSIESEMLRNGSAAIIDTFGNVIVSFDNNNKPIFNGAAKFYPKKDSNHVDRIQFKSGKEDYLLSSKSISNVVHFIHGSAVYNNEDYFVIIDKEGKVLSKKLFSVERNTMTNSPYHISLKEGYRYFLLDSLGNEINEFFSPDEVNLDRNHFYCYTKSLTNGNEDGSISSASVEDNMPDFHSYIQCFDLKGNLINEEELLDYDRMKGFVHGLLKCNINGKLAFYNENKELVWKDNSTDICNYNYTFKRKAFNQNRENIENRIYPTKMIFSGKNKIIPNKKDLSIIVSNDSDKIFNQRFHAQTFWLCNHTSKKIKLYRTFAMDFVVEAKDDKGVWREIELPFNKMKHVSCRKGTMSVEEFEKDYVLTLNKKNAISFKYLKYHGSFKTLLRIRYNYINPSDDSDKRFIYSPEFEGSINYAQFWRPYIENEFMLHYAK